LSTKIVTWAQAVSMRKRLETPPTGQEPDRFPLAHALQGRGIDVRVADPDKWNPVLRLGSHWGGINVPRAYELLRHHRHVDALVCEGVLTPFLPLLLRGVSRYRPPIVINDAMLTSEWRLGRRLNTFNIPRADTIVVMNSNQIQVARDHYNVRGQVKYVPLPVDTDFFAPGIAPPDSSSVPYVLSVGLDFGRDYPLLIAATAGLGVRLIIKAGRYPLPYDKSANPHVEIIERHISYTELRGLYENAAAIAVPTHSTINASGVTALQEGMSMAKPVVVSHNPALLDYIPPANCAISVPIGNIAAMRDALQQLMRDPAAGKAMGQMARAYVLERFTIEKCGDAFIEALQL
jgi:glycosyltransferase involved in cell wall biosynthesis